MLLKCIFIWSYLILSYLILSYLTPPSHTLLYSFLFLVLFSFTVRSICVSILSMLSSCQKKERPPDDSQYNKKNPKNTKFSYHDDDVWSIFINFKICISIIDNSFFNFQFFFVCFNFLCFVYFFVSFLNFSQFYLLFYFFVLIFSLFNF